MHQRPQLSHQDARAIAAAAVADAHVQGVAISVAVLDAGGHLLAVERMDGAPPATAEIAIAKARTAALLQCPTSVLEQLSQARPGFATLPGALLLGGGVPLFSAEAPVGAVGVSGGQQEQDERAAAAGAGAIA